MVDRSNLQVKAGNNRSLTNKWIGPFRVTAAKGTHAYKLDVPGGTRWHNVVHTTLLKPFRGRAEPQELVEDEEENYEVEQIVDSRRVRGKVQYRVRWVGYSEIEDTWDVLEALDNCPDKLREYREAFPRKPRDARDV